MLICTINVNFYIDQYFNIEDYYQVGYIITFQARIGDIKDRNYRP